MKTLLLLGLPWMLNLGTPCVEIDSIDHMIGQMIMVGIGDFNIVDAQQPIFKQIKDNKVGGVVLFEKNILFEDPKPELAKLIETLQKNASVPLLISIDEEGGRVNRMKPRYGFPHTVSAAYLGKLDNLDSTRYYARRTAKLLKSYGINMNFAPVVDVNINPRSPAIGRIQRSYSKNYKKVIKHASEFISIHKQMGISTVLKHFPGHGSSQGDTHLGITDVTDTWQIEELYPYTELINNGVVQAVMTAHIVHKSLDDGKYPASLSKKMITGLLFDFCQFDGMVISDDMQMGAIKNEFGLRESIKFAINAGVNMVMFANNVHEFDYVSASTVHAIIKDLYFEGDITTEQIHSSYEKIMRLKKNIGLLDDKYFHSLKRTLKKTIEKQFNDY